MSQKILALALIALSTLAHGRADAVVPDHTHLAHPSWAIFFHPKMTPEMLSPEPLDIDGYTRALAEMYADAAEEEKQKSPSAVQTIEHRWFFQSQTEIRPSSAAAVAVNGAVFSMVALVMIAATRRGNRSEALTVRYFRVL